MNVTIRWRPLVALLLIIAAPAFSQDDLPPFASTLLGDWEGSGEYEGGELQLSRSWTLELRDRFLRADMRVSMANGATFGALMYWKRTAPGTYEVVWMDGSGRMELLDAAWDEASATMSSAYTDTLAGPQPQERVWEFALLGPDTYVERIYRLDAGAREPLAEFRFTRVSE